MTEFGSVSLSGELQYSLLTEPPVDFKAKFEAVGCFCRVKNKFLLLKRNPNKSDGNTWGVPAGKIEEGESHREAIIRETYEETGLNIKDDSTLHYIGTHYIRFPNNDYLFHMFQVNFLEEHDIKLSLNEHHNYEWVTFSHALKLPLMGGAIELLMHYKELINSTA